MRRRLHLAGLLQYLLMLLLAGVLVLLAMAGASPEVFALALLLGALMAALPAIYIGAVLLPRQGRAIQRVRRDGLPACAEVLADGEQLAADVTRHAGAYKNLALSAEIPVRVLPADGAPPYSAQLSDLIPRLTQLKPGTWLSVRCDPSDPSQAVPAAAHAEPLLPWTVRPVLEADLPQLADLIRTAFEEQRGLLDPPAGAFKETSASLEDRLESSQGLLAEVDGAPVACIFYRFEPDPEADPQPNHKRDPNHSPVTDPKKNPVPGYVYLSRLAVLPEYRRQGIGRCLLAQAEEIAAQKGVNRVRLGMRAEISRNREYYQRLGYRVVEEHSHEGYTKITVYIMEKLRP